MMRELAGGGAAVMLAGWLWGPARGHVEDRVGLEPAERAAEPAP
jgi:hypothetical protein